MLFYSLEGFFEKADACRRLSPEEECALASAMSRGDEKAREALIAGYLPFVAGRIRRLPKELQTFSMALHCVHALERSVDTFRFQQTGETFSHRLAWALRNAITKNIAK